MPKLIGESVSYWISGRWGIPVDWWRPQRIWACGSCGWHAKKVSSWKRLNFGWHSSWCLLSSKSKDTKTSGLARSNLDTTSTPFIDRSLLINGDIPPFRWRFGSFCRQHKRQQSTAFICLSQHTEISLKNLLDTVPWHFIVLLQYVKDGDLDTFEVIFFKILTCPGLAAKWIGWQWCKLFGSLTLSDKIENFRSDCLYTN